MPNQYSYTRSQIRRWAKGEDGGLTQERIAGILAASRRGQVTRDGKATESLPEPKPPPQAGGTEISARELPRHMRWHTVR